MQASWGSPLPPYRKENEGICGLTPAGVWVIAMVPTRIELNVEKTPCGSGLWLPARTAPEPWPRSRRYIVPVQAASSALLFSFNSALKREGGISLNARN